jgi:ribosome-binding factor A
MAKPNKNRSRRQLRGKVNNHCDHINSDDFIDPKEYFRDQTDFSKQDRKALQLCRQVEQTLSYVLCDTDDASMLEMLQVVSVIPAPDASRLLVTLQADNSKNYDHPTALAAIEEHKGRLRTEVANSISRKRAPMLIYNVIPCLSGLGDVDE